MDPKQFGPFLAQARREKGLTQAQLAQALGVTNGAVSKWERWVSLLVWNGLPSISMTTMCRPALMTRTEYRRQ